MEDVKIKRSMLEELRDSLWNDHSAGTSYEHEEHDPFDNRNGGDANNGKDWQGNECNECKLLLAVDEIIVKAGGKSRKKGR